MPSTSRRLLERVKTRLEPLRTSDVPEAKWQAIDWQTVKGLLRRLDSAIDEKDEAVIDQTLAALLERLRFEKRIIRAEIGSEPEDKTQPMPKPVWEILNHIIDKIDYTLATAPPPPKKEPGKTGPPKRSGEETG